MFIPMHGVEGITAQELNSKREREEDFLLLDVRTPAEHAAQAIDGSYLIPIQELAYRMDELPKNKEIIVYCRIGNRSAYGSVYLAKMGYRVKNLEGGIVSWNVAQNASVPAGV